MAKTPYEAENDTGISSGMADALNTAHKNANKKTFKKGGKVRGCGKATRGVRKAKIR